MALLVSANHIASRDGGYEPQRKNNFTISLEAPGANNDLIQHTIESFPAPTESNDVLTIPFGNERRKVAGMASFDACTIVIKDFVDAPVIKSLMAWRKMVYDAESGTIKWAKFYKGNGTVYMFGPDGTTISKMWKIRGVWPSKVDPGGGNMADSASQNMVTVTLEVDRAYLES